MTKLSEADVIKSIDDQLEALGDPAARQRILRWATEKFASGVSVTAAPLTVAPATPVSAPPAPPRSKAPTKAGKASAALALSIVKDLNLKPAGKTSFKDFATQKQPGSNSEKCLIAVYYLKNELGLAKVGVNHVFTCFKVEGWRVPADLINALQYAASQTGWLDTRDREDIRVTTHGDNYVEHDLAAKAAPAKK